MRGAPKKGTTLLLFEGDVLALTQYVERHNLVIIDDEGRLVNGPAWEDELIRKRPRRKRKASNAGGR